MGTFKYIIAAFLLVALCAGVVVTGCSSDTAQETTTLMVYSGAGMQEPMDEIAVMFEEEYGIDVVYNYAGSNALLSQMELTEEGDVYMPGETYYLEVAEDKGFIDYKQLVAYHIPVITVPAGNPANISCIEDLANEGVEVAWGDPEAAAIGRLANKILEKNNLYDEVWENIIVTVPTMNELIVYIAMGQADASINWGDVVYENEDIEVVDIPKEQNLIKIIPIGTLVFSEEPEAAELFVDFCASDEAKAVFESYDFPRYPNEEYGEYTEGE
ncbi:MAG: molybdate ABC transporter substrate-binding protein [Chloroflexota bacterium]|nr:molybdate ABC transporter substrate-binding protein [Chloroflexota bacterium]